MTAPSPYVLALTAGQLFADDTYQRDVDVKRVQKMAAAFDQRLLGVLEVSARGEDRFAILDGQHRHALVLGVRDAAAMLVCQVYEGLTIQDEARLFHEINARRKALSFWDRWKSRRSSGDESVATIEAVLARHDLQVHPSHADGNIAATTALEVIVNEIGDRHLLDSVVVVLLAAFGRTRDAFDGAVMQGMAYVLTNYRPDEIDRDRLVNQLRDLPVRQLRARASALRELHRGTLSRLCAAVIVEQYNRGRGPKVETFFARLPELARGDRVGRERRNGQTAPPAVLLDDAVAAPATGARTPIPEATAATSGMCTCRHSKRLHEDGEGACQAGCRCSWFVAVNG